MIGSGEYISLPVLVASEVLFHMSNKNSFFVQKMQLSVCWKNFHPPPTPLKPNTICGISRIKSLFIPSVIILRTKCWKRANIFGASFTGLFPVFNFYVWCSINFHVQVFNDSRLRGKLRSRDNKTQLQIYKAKTTHGSVLFQSLWNCAHMHIKFDFHSLTSGPMTMEQPGQWD